MAEPQEGYRLRYESGTNPLKFDYVFTSYKLACLLADRIRTRQNMPELYIIDIQTGRIATKYGSTDVRRDT